MFHRIEFRLRGIAALESPGDSNLKQLAIKEGTKLNVEIRTYVVETRRGPVEVADLTLENGSVARAVRYATFRFVDE